MTFSRRGVALAVLLTAVCFPVQADQVVVSDAFGGANNAPLEDRWPDTTDLPGSSWNVVSYDLSGRFTGTLVTAVGNPAPAAWLSCVGNSVGAIAISLASQGAYVKPTQFTISADIGAFNGFVNPALGFYAALPVQANKDTIDAHFTGLRLSCNGNGDAANGTLTLVQNGAASTSVKYTGTFDLKALHHLSYDVDTRSGVISNVTLQGSTSDYSALKTAAFTDPATAYAAVQAVSSARDNPACVDNFKITTTTSVSANTTPPAAPTGLTAIKGREGWNSVELQWAKSSAKYNVYRGTTAGGEGDTPLASNLNEATFTDKDLAEGTYYYKVKAINPNGGSDSNEASFAVVNPLYRDRTAYPSFSLNWNVSTDLAQVTGIFPHPTLTQRAIVATQTGVLLTNDAGRTWNALPQATADNVGPIADVAFHPIAPDTFYLASRTKGVWFTQDQGKTFSQVGSKAKGMASDTVVSLIVYPGDSSHQTLLAVHGDAAVGLSRSRDGGQTWDVVNTDNHFQRIFGGDGHMTQLYLFGSTTKEPDIQSVYTCHTVGEYPSEVVRDVVPTDLFFAPLPFRQAARQESGFTYLATSDSGLYRINNSSQFGMSYDVQKLAYPGVDGWSSIGMTWGPSPDVMNLYLYDPTKAGLVVVNQDIANKEDPGDDLTTGITANDGLPVSPLTKEGAVFRPNANGTVGYAVANGALAIGRAAADVPVVTCAPSAFEINPNDDKTWRDLAEQFNKFTADKGHTVDAAKALNQSVPDLTALYRACQVTVTATVPLKPAPPTSVTVDLSRYGGEPDTQLFDDGQHNDGVANDGVYATTFAFLPGRYHPRNEDPEWRCSGPGRVALGVVASYPGGKRRAAVGVVSYFEQLFDLKMWGEGIGSAASDVENGAKAEPFLNPLAPNQPAYAPRRHKGDVAVRLTVPKGPWTVHFKTAYNRHDIDSYAGLSFFIKLEAGEAPKEIYLQLRDEPEFSPPTTTDKVAILHGLTINADYQRVALPISQALGPGSSLQTDHLSEIILSGDSAAPATLVLDDLSAIANYPPPPPAPEPAQ